MKRTTAFTTVAGFVVAAIFSAAGLALAQNAPGSAPGSAPQPPIPGTSVSPGTPGTTSPNAMASGRGTIASSLADALIVQWLDIDNTGEINFAQFADQHTSNQDVKNFIREVVQDHRDFQNKLRQALSSSSAASTQGAQGGVAGGAQGGFAPGMAPGGAPSGQAPFIAGYRGAPGVSTAGVDPLSLKRQINDRTLALAEQDLGRKKGADFDRSFLGDQRVLHVQLLASLEVARNHVSPALRQVLDQGIQVTQKHLDHINSLMARIEPPSGSSTQR